VRVPGLSRLGPLRDALRRSDQELERGRSCQKHLAALIARREAPWVRRRLTSASGTAIRDQGIAQVGDMGAARLRHNGLMAVPGDGWQVWVPEALQVIEAWEQRTGRRFLLTVETMQLAELIARALQSVFDRGRAESR
jgi:hypothetical protein